MLKTQIIERCIDDINKSGYDLQSVWSWDYKIHETQCQGIKNSILERIVHMNIEITQNYNMF